MTQDEVDHAPHAGSGALAADPLARALGVAALLVAALRFVRLGEWSLWIDEAFTLHDVARPGDFANPLGYWLTGAVLERLGRTDEAALRTTAALLGFACVPLTAWAFRPALGRRAASLAALLLAASSWHLYWSQSARFYTLAMALSLVGAGVCLRALDAGRALAFAAGVAVVGLSAGAHPTSGLLVLGLLVVPLVGRRLGVRIDRGLRRVAVGSLAVGGLASLGWAWELVGHWGAVKGGGDAAHFLLTSGFYFTPLLGAGALVGAVVLLGRPRRPSRAAVLVVPLAVGGAALLVATQVRMAAQYVFVLLPWVAALAALPVEPRPGGAAGGASVAGRAAAGGLWRAAAWSALLVLPALATCLLYLGPRHGERPRWRDAYGVVLAERRPGDLVLGMAAPVGEYYLAPGRRDLRRLREVVYLDGFRAEVPRLWDRHARRTWFVVNHEEFDDWPAEDRREIERTLREDCRLVASFPLFVESRDLGVAVYLRP